MRKLLNKPWFVAALALGAVGLVAHSIMSQMPGSRVQIVTPESDGTIADPAAGDVAAGSAGNPESFRAVLKEISSLSTARNPFLARAKPALAAADKAQQPDETDSVNVGAVWIQAGIAYVLANGHIHRAGDQLGRLTIEAVTHDGIWLTHWKGRDFVNVGSAFTLITSAKQAAALAGSSEG
ncbi:MAG TPA: hypothetical protein VFT72_05465 [Opitutaceae bacterium]|nr:hypothetical protein [Opitutaceae bacterium]